MARTDFQTIVEALQYRAVHQPDEDAYKFIHGGQDTDPRITFRELDLRARQIARILRQNVSVGERVLINHAPGLEYIAALFGCFYADVIAVPVYPPRFNAKLDRLVSIAQSAGARVALTSTSILENIRPVLESEHLLAGMTWIETDHMEQPTAEEFDPNPKPEDLALIQFTSGSTSDPKGVMLTHANLVANVKCICENFGVSQATRSVIWLPPYHDMGLIGGLLPTVWIGFPIVLMSPYSFVQKPARWLQAMSDFRGTISGGPNFAFDLCTRKIREDQMEGLDLSRWKLAFCGAEPIRASVLEAFAQKFKSVGFNKEAFYPCYGLAESTLIVTGGKISEPPVLATVDPVKLERHGVASKPAEGEKARIVVGCGVSVKDHDVKIVAPESREKLSDGQIGEIWVAGPSVAQGYWGRADTDSIFKAKLEGQADETPHLRTGDLGFLLDGELFITGRKKDLLIIRGRNFYPQDIEYTASKSHENLNAMASAAFSVVQEEEEKLVVLQETDRNVPDDKLDDVIDSIRRQVSEEHGLMPYAVSLLKRNSLPLTSSGKIQRFRCRELFLEGALKERKRYEEA